MSERTQKPTREDTVKATLARKAQCATHNAVQEPEINRAITAEELEQGARNGELGDAILLFRLLHMRFCFDTSELEWYRFTGQHWQRDDSGDVFVGCRELQSLYRERWAALEKQAAEAQQDKALAAYLAAQARVFQKAAERLNRLDHLRKALALACKGSADSLAVRPEAWDCCPWHLPVENGLVCLRTGQLEPGRPERFIRRFSPVAYDPSATCPSWERFLAQVLQEDFDAPRDPAQSLVAFLQRLFGMALVGEVLEHKVAVLAGAGGNGKGTLVEVVGEVLGEDLSGPIEAELLLDQGKARSSAGPSPDVMDLRGLRLAWASETNPGRKLDSARLKWLSGGDTLKGRNPYEKRSTRFAPSHSLFLVTNHRPNVDADDAAIWRRLLTVWFSVEFVDREPRTPHERPADKGLRGRLREELPGVLVWLVRGCLDYLAQGLAVPLAVQEEVASYRDENDFLGEWLAQRCEMDPRVFAGMTRGEFARLNSTYHTASQDLYNSFKDWCEAVGIRAFPSPKAWGAKMTRRFPKWKNNIIFYGGVRLLEP